jgi:hypothetical protein
MLAKLGLTAAHRRRYSITAAFCSIRGSRKTRAARPTDEVNLSLSSPSPALRGRYALRGCSALPRDLLPPLPFLFSFTFLYHKPERSAPALATSSSRFYRILAFARLVPLPPSLPPSHLPRPSLAPVERDRADGRIRCWMLGQGNLRNDRFTTAIYAYAYTRICIACSPLLFPL